MTPSPMQIDYEGLRVLVMILNYLNNDANNKGDRSGSEENGGSSALR